MIVNSHFGKDLLSRFSPDNDTLIFMCRSGKRSCRNCKEAITAGWNPANVFNMLGGFEGDKISNEAPRSKLQGIQANANKFSGISYRAPSSEVEFTKLRKHHVSY